MMITKEELRARLKRLGVEMSYLAAQMSGRGEDFAFHAKELNGAAGIVREWVKEMPSEEG